MMGPKSLADNLAERRARRAAERAEVVAPDEVVEDQVEDLSGVQSEEVAEPSAFTSNDLVVMVLNYHSSAETLDQLFAKMSDDEAQKALNSIRENRDRFPSPPDDLTNLLAVVAELLRHDPRYQQVVAGDLSEDQASYLEAVSLPGAAQCFLDSGSFRSLSYPVEAHTNADDEDLVLDIGVDLETPDVAETIAELGDVGMPNAEALLDKQSELNASLTDGVVKAHGRLDEVEGVVAQLAAPVIVTQEDIDAQSSADAGQLPVDLEGDPELNASVVPPVLYDHADDPEFDSQSGDSASDEVDLDQISAGDIAKQLGISWPDVLSLANLDQGDSSTMVSRAEVVTALDALKRLVAVEPEVQAPIDVVVIEVVDGSEVAAPDDSGSTVPGDEVTASGTIDISEDFLGEFVASADACLEILKSI